MRRFFKNSGGLSTLLALALAVFAVGTMFADESDDDKKRNNDGAGVGNCVGRNNCAGVAGSIDDTHTSGEVLAINTLKEPNEIVLGNVDGPVYVKMAGKDAKYLIPQSGIKVRDYIEVVGWKESEQVFWADQISAKDDNGD